MDDSTAPKLVPLPGVRELPWSREQIEALKRAHGEVRVLRAAGEPVALARVPSAAEYQRWKEHSDDEATKFYALAELAQTCVLEPAGAEFRALLDRRPALGDVLGKELLRIAGLAENVQSEKL